MPQSSSQGRDTQSLHFFTGRAAMRADKNSIDYQVNLVALQEMANVVPMTRRERHCLRKWVHKGNEFESDPWNFRKDSDTELHWMHISLQEQLLSHLFYKRSLTSCYGTDIFYFISPVQHISDYDFRLFQSAFVSSFSSASFFSHAFSLFH